MFGLLPLTAFICSALVLVPIPWHWRAGNISTLAISAWLFVTNLIYGINAIIWGNTVQSIAPVWCDITTKLEIGSTVALPAAMFTLCMHLERVSSIRHVRTTHAEKRRRQIIDSALCFGVPLVYMALHYVVQGHRFDIVEGFGCRPTIYVSIASIFLIWVPPLLFSLGAGVFAAIAFAHFWKRRASFAKHLQNSDSALTTGRYFRLMSMAMVEMFFGLLVTSLNMWWTTRAGLRPWVSWEDVHSDWLEVAYFPLFVIPHTELVWTFALWFMTPIASILFFLFFAFGQDAMKEYGITLTRIRHVLRIPDRPSRAPHPSFTSIRHCDFKLPQFTSDVDLVKREDATRTAIPHLIFHSDIDHAREIKFLSSQLAPDNAPALSYTSPRVSNESNESNHDSHMDDMHAV